MSEKTLRHWVVEALSPLHAVSIENCVAKGTPDVSCVLGWLELKHVPNAPVGEETPLRIEHYTPEQKLWARIHTAAGGMCLMVLQVGQELLILDGAVAAVTVGHSPLSLLRRMALYKWTTKPTRPQFLKAVMDSYRPWTPSVLRQGKNFSSSAGVRTGV